MKNILFVFLIGFMLLVVSCDFDNEKVNTQKDTIVTKGRTFQTDMYPDCWINKFTLQKAVVHTPPYASRIDPAFPFSYGFCSLVEDISDTIPRTMLVNFWTLFPKTRINARLVMSIDSASVNKFWTSLPLMDSVKEASVWKQLLCKFELPTALKRGEKISTYVYCPDKQEIYIDDLKVIFMN